MNRQTRLAATLLANWNEVGSGATVADEKYAQEKLQEMLRKVVKDPYAKYKENKIYMGTVKDFFPSAPMEMSRIPVLWDPHTVDCAARLTHNLTYAEVHVGKLGFKHRGTGRSLGGSFIHEVEHLHDLLVDKKYEFKDRRVRLSEFTPRLRQMLRHLKDEPNFRIWNYFHPKHGEAHAENYVDRYLEGVEGYVPTDEERKFAAQAVMKRAKEIYDNMTAQGLI